LEAAAQAFEKLQFHTFNDRIAISVVRADNRRHPACGQIPEDCATPEPSDDAVLDGLAFPGSARARYHTVEQSKGRQRRPKGDMMNDLEKPSPDKRSQSSSQSWQSSSSGLIWTLGRSSFHFCWGPFVLVTMRSAIRSAPKEHWNRESGPVANVAVNGLLGLLILWPSCPSSLSITTLHG